MLGAIIGDIFGSTKTKYNVKSEKFEILPVESRFTRNTVMTLAVAQWLMDDPAHSPSTLERIMQDMGHRHHNPHPYRSCGSEAAASVSPVGLYASSLDEALELSRIAASVIHNHPEEIKGAQAIAASIYLKIHERWDASGPIRHYISKTFGYNLDINLDDIRDGNSLEMTCEERVSVAIMAFLQHSKTRDALRLAISKGDNSSTVGCMAAAIACASHFDIITTFPEDVIAGCRKLLPNELLAVNDRFEAFISRPLYQSYYLGRRIFAGEYPGDKDEHTAQKKIRNMVHFGIRHFVDLTEDGELRSYRHFLPEGVSYERFPIRDCGIPKRVEDVRWLINHIRELSDREDGYVYIHCWGGVGRTGTIAACLLAEYMPQPNFKDTLRALRDHFRAMPKSAHRVTPETAGQEDFIHKYVNGIVRHREAVRARVKDCIRGCLMAGAAGDALGYPIEFMGRNAIISHYGPKGITRFELDEQGKALVSDDTQMTLFTANGLLMGLTRGYMRGIGGAPEDYVAGAYIDWYNTQIGIKITEPFNFTYTWLRDLPELAHQRAPGTTCMKACEDLRRNHDVKNNSKGCGGIMRVAPMGLLDAAYNGVSRTGFYSPARLAEAGAKIARVTHLHPLGYLPAALLTLLISRLIPLTSDEVKRTITSIVVDGLEVMMDVNGKENMDEKRYLKSLTLRAVELAQSNVSDDAAIKQLGEGWTAEEAWAISLYCAIRHIESVEEAIVAAVNHDGDSDSTGSITGNIMGAIYGYEYIKGKRMFCPAGRSFEDTIELHNIILALADDLFTGCIISEYDPMETAEKKQWYYRYCEMRPVGIK